MYGITSINGEILPFAPVKMTVSKSDLYSDATKRSAETGRLIQYLIRRNIYKIDLEFLLDEDQKDWLEEKLENSGTKIIVQFDEKTISMYSSDRTTQLEGAKNSLKYRISFSLIEI